MKKTVVFLALLWFLSINASAQVVREPASSSANTNNTANGQSILESQPAPQTFDAQYSGGLIGYSKKIKGSLTFDDANKRFVFRSKEGKEVFALPYKSMLVIYGDSRSYQPTAARVAGAVPSIFALPAAFIRGKHRYLVVQFDDPDSKVQGTTSFKVANKEFLQSVIQTLGEKAELKQRGDAYYRPREEAKQTL